MAFLSKVVIATINHLFRPAATTEGNLTVCFESFSLGTLQPPLTRQRKMQGCTMALHAICTKPKIQNKFKPLIYNDILNSH